MKAGVVTPDGQWVFGGSYDGHLHAWDLATGIEQWTVIGHSGSVSAVAVTPDWPAGYLGVA